MSDQKVETIDLSEFSAAPPARRLRILFIHHSCGGQLAAAPGEISGDHCIYATHPNGGGLRDLLEREGYELHEASYGSEIGSRTDIFDWPPKFKSRMEAILACAGQDASYPDGGRNEIVMFKSCFPNNGFVGEGSAPGNPAGTELTVSNARAAYLELLAEFKVHPAVLFVCVTAPPLAPRVPKEPLWKRLARRILRKPVKPLNSPEGRSRSGDLARRFNDWLKSKDGWLSGYDLKNVVVFDHYDVLTGGGASNLSQFPTGDGLDSHPSSEGNRRAAELLVPFLNRAVRRAGLTS